MLAGTSDGRQLPRERGRDQHVPRAAHGALLTPRVQPRDEPRALLRRDSEPDGDLGVQVVVVGIAVLGVELTMHLGALGQMQSHEIGGWRQARGVEEGLGGRPHVDRLDAPDAQAARIHGRQRRAPQDVEGECAVVERARQRADVIERGRERPQPVGRHAAECGLEARHAAGRGRQADRRTGVGAEPECAQAGCERARVAARRPARDAVGPGAVDDGAIGAIARCHAPRELVQIRLAQHDGARVEQPPDDSSPSARGRGHGRSPSRRSCARLRCRRRPSRAAARLPAARARRRSRARAQPPG